MSGLRARILERVDQLEATAREAGGESGQWEADGASVILGHPTDEVANCWMSSHYVAEHIAAWPPAAVLTLCAGAREILDAHEPADEPNAYSFSRLPPPDRRHCLGCGLTPDEEIAHTIGDCPTLAGLARMLGIDPDA